MIQRIRRVPPEPFENRKSHILALCWPALDVITPHILSAVDTVLDQQALGAARDDIHIALAETLNNVVEHAYGWHRFGAVAVVIDRSLDEIRIQITDWGRAFPDDALPAATAPDPGALAEGGYGWFLVKATMSEVHYQRGPDSNQMTLILRLNT